jgi:hypothetical protein
MRIISSIVLALAVLATTMGAPSSPAPTTDDTVAVRPISATCPTCGPRVVGPDGVTLGR